MSFDAFTNLATCNGANVLAYRAPSLEERARDQTAEGDFVNSFRAAVRATTRSTERECIVTCYSRALLGQSGSGHFSPIGGYHEETDSVLILDVARFKYPPHWARLEDVTAGMLDLDPDTGRPRGWCHMRMRALAESEKGMPTPVQVPYLPAAAGRRLVEQLTTAINRPAPFCTGGCGEAATMTTMRRWLVAVSTAEPQVLAQLLRVGDADALHETLTRLEGLPIFAELCSAYASIVADAPADGLGALADGIAANFPPLRVVLGADRPAGVEDLGLGDTGELWVLLLLLLPEHLRAAVSSDLQGAWLAQGIARTVRGPWALPLEACREHLGRMLPQPRNIGRCSA